MSIDLTPMSIDLTIDLKTDPPRRTLFSEDAENKAKELDEAAKADGKGKEKNKSTQIRRFYDELVSWQDRVANDEKKFEECEAFIRMLNAKAAYAEGRKLVTPEFVKWMKECIAQIDSPRELRNFRLHFEAMLGFLKALRD